MTSRTAPDTLDVLVVGAGPTGLTLAAQLSRFGARFRIIDRVHDRAHESRALGVQARTLEILQQLGLGDSLVALGNKSAQVTIHVDGRAVASASLSDFAANDTRYPYILFVSQAETERLLLEHLTARGVRVERGVEFVDYEDDALGVSCQMRHGDGHEERLTVQYIAGCDDAHSTVRKRAAIPFQGDAYLQDFMLGDVECDDSPHVPLAKGSIHPCVGGSGIAIFIPLGHPATWRVIAMSARSAQASGGRRGVPDEPLTDELSLTELQAAVDGATGGGLRVHTPAWLTHFRLHHRQAAEYRRGRVFVVGDAAHIHSPVGAQGMNTGIQDAWNLGWKLALVARGESIERLLDTYQEERWPVGRALLRYTDRVFSLVVRSLLPGKVTAWLRRTIPAQILPLVLRSKQLRTLAFRFIIVATFGLLTVIWGCARQRSSTVAAVAVGAYITAAYWFTTSTSFANPAVTIALSLTDTFAGIRPADVPAFILAQFLGAGTATVLFRWLVPKLPVAAPRVLAREPTPRQADRA